MRQDNIMIAKPEKKDATSQTDNSPVFICEQQDESNITEIQDDSYQEHSFEKSIDGAGIENSQVKETLNPGKRRGRPPRRSLLRTKIVKLMGIAKRRRGRPPKRTKKDDDSNIDIAQKNVSETQFDIDRPYKRAQPARSCKKL